jgi:hypothetical protein
LVADGNSIYTFAARQADLGAQRLYSIATSDGSVRWQSADTISTPSACPAIDATRVFTVEDSALRARSKSSGNVLWSVELASGLSPPVVSDGRVYVSSSGSLFARAADTGGLLWTANISGNGLGRPPVVAQGAILTRGDSIVASSPATGQLLWQAAGGDTLDLIADGANVYYGRDRTVTARAAATGALAWTRDTPPLTRASMLLADGGHVFVNAPTQDVRFANGHTLIIDATSGSILADADHGPRDSCCDSTNGYRPYLKLGSALLNHYRWFSDVDGVAAPGYQTQTVVWGGGNCANEQESIIAVVSHTAYVWMNTCHKWLLVARRDQVAPGAFAQTFPPDLSVLASARPTLTWQTSVDNSGGVGVDHYEVDVDDALVAPSVSPPATQFTPTQDLDQGRHTWRVRAVDAAGNAQATATKTFVIDSNSETDTVIVSRPVNPTAQTTATFAFGSPQGGSSFECRLDGGDWTPCVSPREYLGLADDSHTFTVRATDVEGHTDTSPPEWTWTIDTRPPDTTITSTGPSTPTNATTAALTLSSSETPSTFECGLDGAAFEPCDTPKSYFELAAGSHTFRVRATDAAGNTDGSPATRAWTVDLTPPDTVVDNSPVDPSGNTDATFTFHAEANAVFKCRLDTAPAFTDCGSPMDYTDLSEGNHTFRVEAIDQAGNIDPTPSVVGWRIEIVPPLTTITSGPVALSNSRDATFEFEADEPASYSCMVDASETPGCTSPFTIDGLVDGPHTFSVTATDLANKVETSPPVRHWTIDTVAPVAAAPVSPADGAAGIAPSASLRFSRGSDASAGLGSESVTLDGQAIATVPADALCPKGICTVMPPALLGSGSHTWQVVTTDMAANTARSPSWSFVVDADPPVMLLLASPVGVRISDAQPTLSWLSAVDAGSGVTGYDVRIGDREMHTGVTSVQVPERLADGPHAWTVVAVDGAGNRTAPVGGSFVVDTTPPVARLDVGPRQTRPGVVVTLDARASSDSDGRVLAYAFDTDGDGSFDRDTGAAGVTTTVFTAPGAYRVGVRVSDEAGLTGAAFFDVRIVAASNVVIGQGAAAVFEPRQATRSRSVKLLLTPPSAASAVRISNDNDPNPPDIFRMPLSGPHTVTTNWTLPAQTSPGKESKQVFVWFERGTDLVYSSPSIILDEVPPVVTSAVVSRPKAKTKARVRIKAKDTQGTGVKKIRISRKTCKGAFKPVGPRAKVKNGVLTVVTSAPRGKGVLRVQVQDAVANASPCVIATTAR